MLLQLGSISVKTAVGTSCLDHQLLVLGNLCALQKHIGANNLRDHELLIQRTEFVPPATAARNKTDHALAVLPR